MAGKLSAFGGATKAAAVKPKATGAPMFMAEDVRDASGQIRFTKAQVSDAIEKYVEGSTLAKKAETLMETHETVVLDFARTQYARWVTQNGRRPEKSPKILADKGGTPGVYMTTIFMDAERNMDANGFAALASVIGQDNAKKWTVREDVFTMDNEKLRTELPDLSQVEVLDDDGNAVVENGKPKMRNQTVMDLVDAALSEKFADRAEILAGLFTVKPKFTTRKGMIEDFLDCVGRGTPEAPIKYVSALKAGRVTIQLKPGSTGSED